MKVLDALNEASALGRIRIISILELYPILANRSLP